MQSEVEQSPQIGKNHDGHQLTNLDHKVLWNAEIKSHGIGKVEREGYQHHVQQSQAYLIGKFLKHRIQGSRFEILAVLFSIPLLYDPHALDSRYDTSLQIGGLWPWPGKGTSSKQIGIRLSCKNFYYTTNSFTRFV